MTGAATLPGAAPLASEIRLGNRDTTLRASTADDDAWVRALFRESRRVEFPGLPEPMLTTLLDQQFRAQQIGYRQAFPDAEHLIIAHHGQAVGRVIVAFGTPAGPSTLDLIDIVLAETVRGRGIGTDIITSLGRAGHSRGAERFRLAVLNTNGSARRLYERLGFVACGDDGARSTMIKPLP